MDSCNTNFNFGAAFKLTKTFQSDSVPKQMIFKALDTTLTDDQFRRIISGGIIDFFRKTNNFNVISNIQNEIIKLQQQELDNIVDLEPFESNNKINNIYHNPSYTLSNTTNTTTNTTISASCTPPTNVLDPLKCYDTPCALQISRAASVPMCDLQTTSTTTLTTIARHSNQSKNTANNGDNSLQQDCLDDCVEVLNDFKEIEEDIDVEYSVQVFEIQDLMCGIFEYLDLRSLVRCSLVNISWLYASYNPSSIFRLNTNDLYFTKIDNVNKSNEMVYDANSIW